MGSELRQMLWSLFWLVFSGGWCGWQTFLAVSHGSGFNAACAGISFALTLFWAISLYVAWSEVSR